MGLFGFVTEAVGAVAEVAVVGPAKAVKEICVGNPLEAPEHVIDSVGKGVEGVGRSIEKLFGE